MKIQLWLGEGSRIEGPIEATCLSADPPDGMPQGTITVEITDEAHLQHIGWVSKRTNPGPFLVECGPVPADRILPEGYSWEVLPEKTQTESPSQVSLR